LPSLLGRGPRDLVVKDNYVYRPKFKIQISLSTIPIPIPKIEVLQVITKFKPSFGGSTIKSMIFDSTGQNIYFSTYNNSKVYKMNYSSGIINLICDLSNVNGSLSSAYEFMMYGIGYNYDYPNTRANNLWGMCQDAQENIYVAVQNSWVIKIRPDKTYSIAAWGYRSITIGADSIMYTTSDRFILKNSPGGAVQLVFPNFIDDSKPGFSNLMCAGIGPDNYIYAVDCNNGRIVKIGNPLFDSSDYLKWKSTSENAITFAGSKNGINGYQDGIGTEALLNYPTSMVIDISGNLYVTETDGYIRKITPTGLVTTIAGSETVLPTKFSASSITIGVDGNLWITKEGGLICQIQMNPPVIAQNLYSFDGMNANVNVGKIYDALTGELK